MRFDGCARALGVLLLAGCGSGQFETAPVKGIVTCEGNPVTNGTITFTPIADANANVPGKPATGKVGPDGRFVLTTYKAGDGAIVGMNTVFYSPAIPGEGDDEEEDGATAPTPAPKAAPAKKSGSKPTKLLPCEIGGKAQIGVVAGNNDVTIDLTSWLPPKEDEEEGGDRD